MPEESKEETGIAGSIVFSAVQQLLFWVTTSLALDGGVTLRISAYASLAYWVGAGIVMRRRQRRMTPGDRFAIRWGYPILWAFSFIACGIVTRLRQQY